MYLFFFTFFSYTGYYRVYTSLCHTGGFPGGGSDGKEFACNMGGLGEGDGTPLQYSCLENPMDGGAWWAAVHGVAKSRARLSYFTFTFHFHALEKEMATHSSVLAWRIPGTGEAGGLPSMGSHRVGHDWSDLAAWEAWVWSLEWEDPLEAGMETHSSILAWRIPKDRGTWRAAVHGVTRSQTQLSDCVCLSA